tara:strand:- start:1022 stop:1366 length:345 start_codon:yes stop_codon:yes gene_type:complete
MEAIKSNKSKYFRIVEIVPFILLTQGHLQSLVLYGVVFYGALTIRNLFSAPRFHQFKISNLEIRNIFFLIIAISFMVTAYNQISKGEIQHHQIYLYATFAIYMITFFRIGYSKS